MKKIFLVIIILTGGFFLLVGYGYTANNMLSKADQDTLLVLAKEKATELKADVTKFDIKIKPNNNNIAVEFWPKVKKDEVVKGGGFALIYKKNEGTFNFLKFEGWK